MKDAQRWDIFCRVVDNYGDIGVCWRLCADLAARAQEVRLWVDDASALAWMAPQGCAGVQVAPWDAHTLNALQSLPRADVLIEAFGCELGPELVAWYAQSDCAAVWINLEYLSAERFVERSHGLPSPVLQGPGQGLSKHFFYPGFTPATGGLLREADLAQRQRAFDPHAWLAQWGIEPMGRRLVSLFCYEPPALAALLEQLIAGPQPTLALVTAGRAAAAVRAQLQQLGAAAAAGAHLGALSVHWLAPLTQRDYDHLLWSCDMNFVRGEDSLVRAIWAGKPFVWNIYPQQDQAHRAKLDAFLNLLHASDSLRRFHRVWNGLDPSVLGALDLPGWGKTAVETRRQLLTQSDLTQRLLRFVEKNR